MKNFTLLKTMLAFALMTLTVFSMNAQIISQYVETNSGTTPKGVEIWNNTSSVLDFSTNNLVIQQGTNGNALTTILTIDTGTLAPGTVMVIGTSDMASYIPEGVTFVVYAFTFNGDDALAVIYGTTTTDIFGNPGVDPGSAWSGNGVSTANQNIQLLSGITTGASSAWTDPSTRFETVSTTPATLPAGLTGFGVAPTAVSTPIITANPISLGFSAITTDAPKTEDIAVSGSNLTADISATLSGTDAAQFSINPTSISQSGGDALGTITVTYSPSATASTHTATLTLTSVDATSVEITLSGETTLPPLTAPETVGASDINDNGFTANWSPVTSAESYEVNVYTKNTTGSVTATDLFFSEYVEGSSNNKYLEIYNGTGTDVDLSDYRIELYANGANTASNTLDLSGELKNGKVYVIGNASGTIFTPDVTSTVTFFNGDDAIALRKISTDAFVDIIGRIGEQPVPAWTDGVHSTLDKTLVRKSSVTGGITANPVSGFPTLATEWDVYDRDVASYLGAHTLTDQLVEISTPITSSPFSTTETNLAISALEPGTEYFFTVSSTRGADTSPESVEVKVLTTGTAIDTDISSIKIYSSNGQIIVDADETVEIITIFNVAGQKVAEKAAVNGLNTIPVSGKGLYVVKLDNNVVKVFVK